MLSDFVAQANDPRFGVRLRAYREHAGLSLSALAVELLSLGETVTGDTIADIERGLLTPSVPVRQALMRLVGMSEPPL